MAVRKLEWFEQSGAARWTANQADNDYPAPTLMGRGRAPHMSYWPWFGTGTVQIGATHDGWFWRCKERKCRYWLGVYPSRHEAYERGAFHAEHCDMRK